jgi:putative Holliday junction resolvase
MAIDYGRKRSGVAVTDGLQLIAGGLDTVASGELISYIGEYIKKEQVDCLVVGLPFQTNNQASENAARVNAFVSRIRREIPALPVEMYDERYTSVMAHRAMIDGGLKKKRRQDKALVDEISAVILLQSWMESKRLNV